MGSPVAGTKRFESPAEIEREPGFSIEAPIDIESYDALIGWYAFSEEKLRCCVLKPNGSLCLTPHGRGWVARRKDSIVTLIGGDCAKDKFAAGSIALNDIRRAENEIVRRERESRLQELLTDRDAKVAEIDDVFLQLKSLNSRLEHLAREIGPQPWARVQLQAMSGSSQVTIQGYTPAVRDRDGDIVSPRKEVRIAVGSLPGVRACGQDSIKRELLSLSHLRHSYSVELPPDGPKRTSAVKVLTAALSGQPQRIEQARRLLSDGELFERSDLSPIIFLSRDPGARTKLAQFVHRRYGASLGRSAAKDWLQRRDREVAAANGVSKLDL